MISPEKLEKYFHQFTDDLSKWIQDGIQNIDHAFLKEAGINVDNNDSNSLDDLPFYFHVIETDEKVTLFNNQFIVWIIPKIVNDESLTYTLICYLHENEPKLEIVFTTKQEFNSPKLLIKTLRYYLTEMIDTESEIASIGKNEGY